MQIEGQTTLLCDVPDLLAVGTAHRKIEWPQFPHVCIIDIVSFQAWHIYNKGVAFHHKRLSVLL